MNPTSSLSQSVKLNFTLEPIVAEKILKIDRGQRSRWVNQVLKNFLSHHTKNEMIAGFKQKREDSEMWEDLGFETWN